MINNIVSILGNISYHWCSGIKKSESQIFHNNINNIVKKIKVIVNIVVEYC